jgi:alanine racemase
MKPVIGLQARVLQVRNVPRNAAVGYGATWTAKRGSRIAVIAAGYADGILRAAAATERDVLVAGKRCRIVGRISMDLLTVDVTDLPDNAVRRGSLATLIGGELGLDVVAAQAGTIGYEVLSSLGRRYHRIWKV